MYLDGQGNRSLRLTVSKNINKDHYFIIITSVIRLLAGPKKKNLVKLNNISTFYLICSSVGLSDIIVIW